MGLKLEPTERHYNNAPDMASGALEVSNDVKMLSRVDDVGRGQPGQQATTGSATTQYPRGCRSVVERHVANVNVGRSNRLTRFPTLAWMSGLSPVIPGE